MAAANKAAGKTGIFRLFLSILLLLILPAASLSETVPWLEALEQEEGFEQQDGGNWVYQQMAAYPFTDGKAFFGLEGATHTVSGEVLICAFAGLSDIRNQPLASVTRSSRKVPRLSISENRKGIFLMHWQWRSR